MHFKVHVWKDTFASGFLALDEDDERATIYTGRTPRHAIAKVLRSIASKLETD